MKKILVSACAALAAAAALAGMNNVVISFSTPGTDTYSDGMAVRDGERYALVWTPSGSEFAGINSDGKAAGDSKVVISAPIASGGRCPPVLFEVDGDYVSANYPNGTWSVVLLDTRVFKIDAETGRPVVDEATNLRVVSSCGAAGVANGYGVVGSAKAVSGGDVASAGGVAAAAGAVSSDTPAPVVKGIGFDGDYVYVTISGTSPAHTYSLMGGATPDKIAEGAADPADFGSATQDIILVKPKKAGGEFFKVNCK